MNKAESCLLLILSLLAGGEGRWRRQNCTDGWAEFTCNHSNAHGENKSTEIISERSRRESSPGHDPKNNSLTVVIKCNKSDGTKNQQLFELSSCLTTFTQALYEANKNTITCDFPVNKYKSWFFCKERDSRCEDILSKEPSQRSKMQFTHTDRGFNVSWVDAGVYWCGLGAQQGNQPAALRRVQVQVQEIRNFERVVTIGQNFSYFCIYNKNFSTILICKGADPQTCGLLVSTDSSTNHRFSLKNTAKTSNITITVTGVRVEDAGTYWCGGRNPNRTDMRLFHRFQMKVTPPTTAAPPPSHGHSQIVIVIVSVCVAVMLLLCVFNFILFYKRLLLLRSSNIGSDAEHVIEDNIYEEIQDVNKPIMTIYTTASFGADPSDSQSYSLVKVDQGPDAEPKPSDYSTVSFTRCPSSSSTDAEPWTDPPEPSVHSQQDE
ncbi:uncharacterized protein LOC114855438 [Betta splendens]|uniref:Uncharacterized protein LOC114855438 n=1 Tax=Betta splendens TaxID=158456 RepID=A0A6P7MIW3_BETSP|nr:uncharacterized protein LOC114855438 [Betta splendens]